MPDPCDYCPTDDCDNGTHAPDCPNADMHDDPASMLFIRLLESPEFDALTNADDKDALMLKISERCLTYVQDRNNF